MRSIRLLALIAAVAAGSAVLSGAPARAQVVALEGVVRVKEANGTLRPVEGATVEIIQTDKKGSLGPLKTKKDGKYFTFGAAIAGTYTLLVYGPGINPIYLTGVRPGVKPVNDFEASPGDGRKITLADIGAATGGTTPGRSEADAKAAAEAAAAAAAERAKDEAAVESFKSRVAHFDAGNKARTAQDFNTAVAEFKMALDGIDQSNPENSELITKTAGNLAATYFETGINLYNESIKQVDDEKKATRAKSKEQLILAANAIAQSITALQLPGQNKVVGVDQAAYYETQGKIALRLAELYSDKTRADLGHKAYLKAAEIVASSDKKKKLDHTIGAGDVYRHAGKINEAIDTYKAVLAEDPNNTSAMYWIGITAFKSEDVKDYQISADYFKLFIEKAGNDPRVEDAKKQLDVLKTGFKITPRKIS